MGKEICKRKISLEYLPEEQNSRAYSKGTRGLLKMHVTKINATLKTVSELCMELSLHEKNQKKTKKPHYILEATRTNQNAKEPQHEPLLSSLLPE